MASWSKRKAPPLFTRNHCEVVGVDINKEIVNKLNQGITHIEEPGISEIIKNAVENKIYMASLTPKKADAYIITVPTPYIVENYSCDLSYVVSACKSIIPYLEKENTIIIESTRSRSEERRVGKECRSRWSPYH